MKSRGDAYFYDDRGEAHSLEPSGRVALDLEIARNLGLGDELLERWRSDGIEVRHAIVIVEVDTVPEDAAAALDEASALFPVFEADGALIMVLPEIRVQSAGTQMTAKLQEYLDSSPIAAEVEQQSGERLVIRPATGRGWDALDLANLIEEALHPPMAQARFVRVARRPRSSPSPD